MQSGPAKAGRDPWLLANDSTPGSSRAARHVRRAGVAATLDDPYRRGELAGPR